jgi:hypothetical protein
MEPIKKKSIMKDRQKVKECDNLFHSYVDCVIHNSNDSPKERCGFLEYSLEKQCYLPSEWFEQRIYTKPQNQTKDIFIDKSTK